LVSQSLFTATFTAHSSGSQTDLPSPSGSVGLPYDGDPRASYLLIDDGKPTIRRVAYDVEREVSLLWGSGLPRANWLMHILRSANPQMP
jgi:hypothetical protein